MNCHPFSRKLPAYTMTPTPSLVQLRSCALGFKQMTVVKEGFLEEITTHTDRGAALGSAAPVDFTEPSNPGQGLLCSPPHKRPPSCEEVSCPRSHISPGDCSRAPTSQLTVVFHSLLS